MDEYEPKAPHECAFTVSVLKYLSDEWEIDVMYLDSSTIIEIFDAINTSRENTCNTAGFVANNILPI